MFMGVAHADMCSRCLKFYSLILCIHAVDGGYIQLDCIQITSGIQTCIYTIFLCGVSVFCLNFFVD